MNFLTISILGYALNGGNAVIDKILLNKLLPSPFVYAFYISIFGFIIGVFLPFGVIINPTTLFLGIFSGVSFVIALLLYFQGLKLGKASIVTPVVGALNPLFTLIIGGLFLGITISQTQLLAIVILIAGSLIISASLITKNLRANSQLSYMIFAGLTFAVSYLSLAKLYTESNFLTGIVIKSIAGSVFVALFLIFPKIRSQIFSSKIEKNRFRNNTTFLLFVGQTMGGLSGLLLTYGVSLANPALVNSLFGVQYLVILSAAFILGKKHPQLLDENLSKGVLIQKILGATILSFGVYLLSR